ncbi:RagB/SusD family nutrient uptake outer membrane protein [Segetibacter koreensis]|uniref:RagB/SusD family nutrient uptake outer membrane protein n=1 Tax=Segetibacter koreensis TaxID=398037 RepID=UPI00035FAA98|nr:RagB/SusD family nutrient uptake outer membrane protein [Segetibacter koreensis]
MKKIINISWSILSAISIFIMFSGCQKFLDRKPLSATLNDLPGGGLEGQVLGLYDALRQNGHGGDGFNSLPFMCMHEIRSDDAIYAVDPGAASYKPWLDQFKYDKTAWFNGLYWSDHYAVIGKANTALQFADSLKLTDSASTVFVAEARFVRAYSYFDLVRTYGQVPLLTKRVYNSAEANIPKSSEADIYKQIDEDLAYASAHLPLTWKGTAYIGRLTSGAAKTLQTKTYLFRHQYPQALATGNDIINSGVYSLNPNYSANFNYSTSNGPESIFEYQAYGSPGGSVRYDVEWAEPQLVRGSGDWNLGWGWNIPDKPLINAFEPSDPRLNATILFSGKNDGYGNTVPDTPTVASPYWNKKVYTDPALRKTFADNGSHFLNHVIYRYADVLLMTAEAANETGDGATAAPLLEQVRARARGLNTNTLPPIPFVDQAQMRAAIQHERRVELGMESERFFDLVRWGLAVQVLGPAGYTDKNRYYPLPQDVVTQSNGVLVQNPDY